MPILKPTFTERSKAKKILGGKTIFNCADTAIVKQNDSIKKQWNANEGRNHLNPWRKKVRLGVRELFPALTKYPIYTPYCT